MPKECPRCKGKGVVIIRSPHYQIGSLALYLKQKVCPLCDGQGVIYEIIETS